MQSSYRIIKASKIEENAVIAPPILEKIYNKLSTSNTNESPNNQINFDDIYKSIETQARLEAVKIIEAAKALAGEITKNAEISANEIYKKSMDEGYQEGYSNGYKGGYEYGLAEAEKDALNTRQEAEEFLKNCQAESRIYIKNVEKEIIDLSMIIAKQIVKTELTINPEAIFKIAESVISASVEKKQIILKVNPQDFAVIKNRKDELSIYVEDSNNIIVVADPTLTQGSFKAESPSGFIDGTLDSQLEEIKKKLIEV